MPAYTVGVIKGDGIGPEVTAQAVKALKALEHVSDLKFDVRYLDGGGDYYLKTGKPMPYETPEECAKCHIVYKGPVGAPVVDTTIPEGTMERGLLLPIRQDLGLYANIRPVKPVYLPLIPKIAPFREGTADGIDIIFVRENSEGLYALPNKDESRALEELSRKTGAVYGLLKYTPEGVERIIRFAFNLAGREGRKDVASLDKANVLEPSAHWKHVFGRIAKGYPDKNAGSLYIDNGCYQLVMNPRGTFKDGIVVTENVFGDIITDEAAAWIGSLGMAGSANVNPERLYMFEPQHRELYLANPTGAVMAEPVHGTYPQRAGKNLANPIGAIKAFETALQMMGFKEEAEIISEAVVKAMKDGYRTEDIAAGMQVCSTEQMGSAIADNVRRSRN